MPGIFSEFKIKDLELKNRIVMAPMCMDSASEGYANDWHIIHYATRAIGGIGLIIIEATAVSSEGKIESSDLGIWDDKHIEGLKDIVDKVHKHGGKIGIQLNHAGRKASLDNERVIAPSNIPFSEEYKVPEKMTHTDIKSIIESFKESARRALIAGFDIIELHGAHGYLINQFMSPLSNKRDDEYGGSIENRARFLFEVIQAVKDEWPHHKPIMLRVSGEEYDENGNSTEDIAEIINLVKNFGIDIVNISSGGIIPKRIITYPGYQIEVGKKIRNLTGIPALVGGLVTDVSLADEIIWNGRGDLVYLGRELLRNPYWALQTAKTLGDDVEWPKQYERSKNIRKFGF